MKNTKVTEKIQQEMRLLRAQGLSYKKIAVKVGIPGRNWSIVRYHVQAKYHSVQRGEKVRVKSPCPYCGQIRVKYRNPTAQERKELKKQKVEQLLARAKELGLV